MAKILLPLFLCFLLLTNAVKAQEYTTVYSLKECLDFAVNNSYEIHKSNLEIREADYQIGEAKSGILPQVNVNGGYDKYIALPSVVLPGEIIGQPGTQIPVQMGTKNELNISASLEQVIFSPSLFTGIKVAKNNLELQRLRNIMTKEEIIFDVSNTYYDILNSMKELESTRYILAKQDSLYALTEERVKEGFTREVDLNRIKVNLTNMRLRESNLLNTISQQKKYLQILMGMPIEDRLELDDSEITQIESQELHMVSSSQGITQLNMLEKQKTILELQKKQEQVKYLPSLSAVVSGGYQFQSDHLRLTKDPWFNSLLVGVRLSIPVFDGLGKRNRIKQIQMQSQRMDYEIIKTRQEISMNFLNAKDQLEVSYKSVQAQSENLQLAEKTYQQTIMLYNEGLAGITDVLDTETTLQEAKTSYAMEIVKYRKTEIDLLKANGELETLLK